MNLKSRGIESSLRLSGIFLILGLAVELISLLWEKPLAFLLFAFVGGALFFAGIVLFLFSLLSASTLSANASANSNR
jgi:hypothetical protein